MTEPVTPPVVTVTPPVVTVTPRDNGPYRITGPIVLQDPEGGRWELAEGKSVFLCRCGQSQAKPFCDGSHGGAGFSSAPRARVTSEAATG